MSSFWIWPKLMENICVIKFYSMQGSLYGAGWHFLNSKAIIEGILSRFVYCRGIQDPPISAFLNQSTALFKNVMQNRYLWSSNAAKNCHFN